MSKYGPSSFFPWVLRFQMERNCSIFPSVGRASRSSSVKSPKAHFPSLVIPKASPLDQDSYSAWTSPSEISFPAHTFSSYLYGPGPIML